MVQVVEAMFDGAVLRPEKTLTLAPNTRVRLVVESLGQPEPARGSAGREAAAPNPFDTFVGCMSPESADAMLAAIEDAFERIEPDGR